MQDVLVLEASCLHISCPKLGKPVELSPERERHIASRHPELAAELSRWIQETLHSPDAIRVSRRSPRARLFSRCYPEAWQGKHIVVVVYLTEASADRVATAYLTRKARGGLPWRES